MDKCDVCHGRNDGVLGNENVVNGVIMCDYCHAEMLEMAKRCIRTTDCSYIGANDEYHGIRGLVKVYADGHAEAKFRDGDEFQPVELSEIEIDTKPDPVFGRAVYVGPIEEMTGLTALAKQYIDCIEVQVDKFDHPMSHGWHTFLSSNWEFTPDDAWIKDETSR